MFEFAASQMGGHACRSPGGLYGWLAGHCAKHSVLRQERLLREHLDIYAPTSGTDLCDQGLDWTHSIRCDMSKRPGARRRGYRGRGSGYFGDESASAANRPQGRVCSSAASQYVYL